MADKWVEHERLHQRRPIEAHEVPALEATAAELRRLRDEACMTRVALARASGLSVRGIRHIERAERRTRQTTLRALALGLSDGDTERAEAIADRLTELAGDTIAPSNRWSDRRERHRPARQARIARRAAVVLPVAERVAEAMLRETLRGHVLVPAPPRDRTRARGGMPEPITARGTAARRRGTR